MSHFLKDVGMTLIGRWFLCFFRRFFSIPFNSNALKAYACKKPKSGDWPTPKPTEAPKAGFCKQGYKLFDGFCYKVKNSLKTWADAEADCKKEGPKYNLASIHSLKENALVASLLYQNTSSQAWLGGLMSEYDSKISWSDYSEVNMDNWAAGQPLIVSKQWRKQEMKGRTNCNHFSVCKALCFHKWNGQRPAIQSLAYS